jgi:hypothetical protein
LHLETHFERFYDRVRLDEARNGRISDAVSRLSESVESDVLQDYVVSAPLPQGSWAHGTIARPPTDAPDYDVDLLLPMDFNRFPADKRNPHDILDYVRGRLKKWYGASVRTRDKCVRIQYGKGDDFHIDVVPAHVLGNVAGPFQICSKKMGFIRSDPAKMTQWVREMDQHTRNQFSRSIVCLKRWRDFKMGSSAPKSILLTCLAGQAYLRYEGHRDLLTTTHVTLEAMVRDLVVCMRAQLESSPRQIVIPGSQDDLYGPWPQSSHDTFLNRLRTFEDRADRALKQGNARYAVDHWRFLFGPMFPGLDSA